MALHNIEKWDFWYAVLKLFVDLNFRSYYKSVTVKGKENIPKDSPVIFAPNHQNALQDALAILKSYKGQLVFLARSDVFKEGFISRFLFFLKIMPVYRMRDGYANLKKNEETTKKVMDVLKVKRPMIILPEGNHGDRRQLRPLKKGICRLAFQAETQNNYQMGIKIVPIGIDYTDYQKFQHSVFLNYGAPIDVDQFLDLYRSEPAKANNQLKNAIAEGMKKVMIHIDFDKYYDVVNDLRDIYKYRSKEHLGYRNLKHPNKFEMDKKFIALFEDHYKDREAELEELDKKNKTYQSLLKKLNLRDWVIRKQKFSWLGIFFSFVGLLVALPLYLYGIINNILPYFTPELIVKKIKDPQFVSSVRSGMRLVTTWILGIIQAVVVGIVASNFLIGLGYFISLPLTFYFAYYYLTSFKKTRAKLKFNVLKAKKNKNIVRMTELRKAMVDELDEVLFPAT